MEPMGAEQFGAERTQEFFEPAAVFKALTQHRHQRLGHVHAPSAPAPPEGEYPSRMLVPAGASGAGLADARFFDQGQGTLERRPQRGQLLEELLLGAWGWARG